MTPPKLALFEKLEIYLSLKIFRLWVKIRNFWVPKKTSICHLFTLWIWKHAGKVRVKGVFEIQINIWGKKSSWGPDLGHNTGFWGISNAYVAECRKISRRRRNMVESAFESWWFIFLRPKKILVIRTHPEELRVLEYIAYTWIYTNSSQQWGQQMLTKWYLDAWDFLELPRTESKAFEGSKTAFEGSKTVFSTLIWCFIVSDKVKIFCVCVWIHTFSTKSTKSLNVLILSEALSHPMRVLDTFLERSKVLLWVLESPMSVPDIYGTLGQHQSVDLIDDYN